MKKFDYQYFYDKVGKINGWDFYEEVIKRCKKTDILLDIGTGGGENILRIAASLFCLIGIDLSSGMLETAKANLQKSDVCNVRFVQIDADKLQFPNVFFDVVSSRHAPFSSTEVFKVLKSGGWFLTQQVSEADKLNIKNAFGRGQADEKTDGALKDKYISELEEAGFSEIQSFEYNAIDYFKRPEDLIFLLTSTPTIPNFGEDKKDFKILNEFIEKNRNVNGIQTNSKRFLIIAKK